MTSRGAGKRILFEDDDDRAFYMERLKACALECDATIYAWCLMNNHVHLLVKCELDQLSELMRKLNTSYAQRFNGRHGHVGPVFQGRFASTPVDGDAHFVECVRYIHLNPKAAGLCQPEDYRWSSYGQYLGCGPDDVSVRCDTSLALSLLDDIKSFHEDEGVDVEMVDFVPMRPAMSDGEASELAKKLYGAEYAGSIASMEKLERDDAIARLHARGISVRQIERLTGIGRGTVFNAIKSRRG